MTERFEIENLIEQAEGIVFELAYEAATVPGMGESFAAKLLEAKQHTLAAIAVLKEAAELL